MPFEDIIKKYPKLGETPEVADSVKKATTELQGEINSLNSTIESKNAYIESLGNEKIELKNQLAKLKNEYQKKENQLKTAISDKNSEITTYKEQLNQANQTISRKDSEIKVLQNKNKELAESSNLDPELIKDYETQKLVNETLKTELTSKTQYLIDIQTQLNSTKVKLKEAEQQTQNLQDLYLKEQEENNTNKQKLETINQKLNSAFSATQLADYLTHTIDSFNTQVNVSDTSVNYVINDMDVELKASVAKNELNQMILSAPSIAATEENALSSIKFSVRAVPKV